MVDIVLRCLREMGHVLFELSPWLLFGLFMAGLLHVTFPVGFVRRHLGGRGFLNVLWATLVGVPMPLCSCGVIPTTIGLKRDGASDGAAVGFLISTPQTGVDSILVSARFLGWPFAIFKIFSALVTGLIGGQLTNVLAPDSVPLSGGNGEEPVAGGLGPRLAELFHFGFVRLLGDIYLWVLMGIVVSGLISALVPENFFAGLPWMQGLPGMLIMLAIALPMYVCATSSVPIAAALVQAGLPTGAALVFLMAGPATNAATIGAIWRAFGRRVTAIYIGTVAVSSVVLGLLFDWVIGGKAGGAGGMVHVLPHGVSLLATAVLTGLLLAHAGAALAFRLRRLRREDLTMSGGRIRLAVRGMTCQHCVSNVRKAIEAVEGVSSVAVDLKKGRATVTGENLDASRLAAAVAGAGYEAAAADQALNSAPP